MLSNAVKSRVLERQDLQLSKTQSVISGWRFVFKHILNKSKYFSKSLTKYVDSVFAIIYTDGELKQV